METGYLYIIQSGTRPVYKIGITSGEPIRRLNQLQTGNPDELRIVDLYQTKHYVELEKKVHHYLRFHRVNGEWFAVDLITIENTINALLRNKTLINGKYALSVLVRKLKTLFTRLALCTGIFILILLFILGGYLFWVTFM